jgi:DNA-binding response OmpR family regulator
MGVLLIENDLRTAGAAEALLDGQGIAVEHVPDGPLRLRRAGDPAARSSFPTLSSDQQANVDEVRLAGLRRKLEDGSAAPCIESLRGRGYPLLPA